MDDEQQQEQPVEAPAVPYDPASGPPKMEQFDDYDKYTEAKIEYATAKIKDEWTRESTAKAKQASDEALALLKSSIKEGVAEAIAPAPPPPVPDDESRMDREKAQQWKAEHLREAEKARRAGDTRRERAEIERADYLLQDLQKAGPTEAEKLVEESRYQQRFRAIQNLGEPSLVNHPNWGNPQLSHDSMVYMNEHNASDRADVLVLPTFDPETGQMLEIKPQNMQCIELPREDQKRLVRNAYAYAPPNATPEDKLRRLYSAIKSAGFASSLRPTIAYPQQPKVKEEGGEPEEMGQAEFEAWRNKNKARRY